MSSGLPLEILGLIGPVLCWVERVERPGLPEYWYGDRFPFKERMRAWLMRDLPTYSYDNLDEIIQLARDPWNPGQFPDEPGGTQKQVYTSAPPEGFDLVYMFHQLAGHYFRWAGNELCIREGRLVELHELAIRFPVRHLVRYCHADAVTRGYISQEHALELPVQMSRLHTTYQGLRTVVDKGLSEGHIHLNGIISADEAWPDQLLRAFTPEKQGGLTQEEKKLMALSHTALRVLAMGVLYYSRQEEVGEPPYELIERLDRLYQAAPVEDRGAAEELREALAEKYAGFKRDMEKKKGRTWASGDDWLRLLAEPGIRRIWRGESGFAWGEKIAGPTGIRNRIKLLEHLHFTVQRILVESCVRKMGDFRGSSTYGGTPLNFIEKRYCQNVREFIHQVFVRYLIYHTHYRQRAVQSGRTTGLRYFQRFYDSPQRWLMPGSRVEEQGLAVERLGRTGPLREVEGRISPPSKGISGILPWLVAFARQAEDNKLDKFGIVVHFIKKEYNKLGKAACSTDTLNLRHGKIRRLTQGNAFKLFRILSTPNPVTPFIVGIDAANLELTTPPEVFAPAFRFLRMYPVKLRYRTSTKETFRKYKEISALVENRRLGMTFHVGEDFRHLLSGLRAIHEVIEFLKPLPGDRLGHAIALALDPEVWAAQVGYQAVLPMQEWLDTLVWVHHLLGPGHNLIGELAVEDQIQLYSRRIYGKTVLVKREKGDVEVEWTPATLYDAWVLRQIDPYSLDRQHLIDDNFYIRRRGQGAEHRRWADVQRRVLNEIDEHVGTEAAYHLVKLYWYGPHVRNEGSKIITIDIQEKKKHWLEVFREAQKKVQKLVLERQVVVEVNPSSNRVIGPMEKMADHPVFALTLDKEQHLARQIRVTINTDDPGVFSTSLPHEFYLLGEILVNRGVSEAEVVEWLNWLRENGKDYSFLHVLPHAKDKNMAAIIHCLVKKYAPLLQRLQGERRKYEPLESRVETKWKENGERGKNDIYDQLKTAQKKLRDFEKYEPLLRELEKKGVR